MHLHVCHFPFIVVYLKWVFKSRSMADQGFAGSAIWDPGRPGSLVVVVVVVVMVVVIVVVVRKKKEEAGQLT